jgi:hypothetical protein
VHLIADTQYEIPVAMHLTPASHAEQIELRVMRLDQAQACRRQCLDRDDGGARPGVQGRGPGGEGDPRGRRGPDAVEDEVRRPRGRDRRRLGRWCRRRGAAQGRGAGPLLDGVGQFMAQEVAAVLSVRGIAAGGEGDMPSDGIGLGADRQGGPIGRAVRVDAHVTQVPVEPGLEEGPGPAVQGLSGRVQDGVDDRRRPRGVDPWRVAVRGSAPHRLVLPGAVVADPAHGGREGAVVMGGAAGSGICSSRCAAASASRSRGSSVRPTASRA